MKKIIFQLLIICIFFIPVNAEIINKIELENNTRVSKESVIAFGNIKLGKNYSETEINQILVDLYNTNFFSDIKLSIENNVLIVNVTERKIIQTVVIDGIKSKENTEKILKQLKLKDKSPFDEFVAEQDLINIKNSLNRSGYYFAKVAVTIKENNNDTLDLIYTIDTGEKALIKNIKFIGNKIFKKNKLRKVIVSEEAKFWKFLSTKKTIDVRRFDLDQDLLNNFYKNNGYYNVKINSSYAKLIEDNFFEIVFNIDAGEKFYFNDLKINLPTEYNQDDFINILNLLESFKGKPYSLNRIEDILDEIDLIALNENYEFGESENEVEPNWEIVEILENTIKLKASYRMLGKKNKAPCTYDEHRLQNFKKATSRITTFTMNLPLSQADY